MRKVSLRTAEKGGEEKKKKSEHNVQVISSDGGWVGGKSLRDIWPGSLLFSPLNERKPSSCTPAIDMSETVRERQKVDVANGAG